MYTTYALKDDVLEFGFAGLLPSTVHYIYIDSLPVSSSLLMPEGGVLGDQLISDDNGNLNFDYFYVSGAYDVESKDGLNEVNESRIYKRRLMVVCSIQADTMPESVYSSASSVAQTVF